MSLDVYQITIMTWISVKQSIDYSLALFMKNLNEIGPKRLSIYYMGICSLFGPWIRQILIFLNWTKFILSFWIFWDESPTLIWHDNINYLNTQLLKLRPETLCWCFISYLNSWQNILSDLIWPNSSLCSSITVTSNIFIT